MRILYATSVDPTLGNGPGVNEREFLHALQRHPDVVVHAILPLPDAPWPVELDRNGVTFTLPRRMRKPVGAVRHQLSQWRALRRHVRSGEWDLVVLRPYPFPIGAVAALSNGTVPYTLKNLGPKLTEIVDTELPRGVRFLARINRILLERLVKGSLFAETVSERQREALAAQFPTAAARFRVVDNAVNTDRFRPVDRREARARTGLSNFRHIIGYAGNYPWVRGAKEIVDALPLLRDRFPGIGALVLGGGDEHRVRTHAESLGVADICRITGQVPFDAVPDYIGALDVGVSILEPREWGASEQKVRQYMAAGRPVVTTPGSSGFVTEIGAGTIVDYANPTEFAEAASYWLSAPAGEWEAASARARAYAERELSVDGALNRRIVMWCEAMQGMEVRP